MTTASLQLQRRWGGPINRAPWDIELDGAVVGTIAVGDTVELPIEPGQHTLRVQRGRRLSPLRSFDASDGDMVRFHCRGAMLWPQYIAALMKPDLWISLRRE